MLALSRAASVLSQPGNSAVAVPPLLIGGLLACAFTGMVGGTWDAAWHVTRTRETFWSPPHLLLYAATSGSLLLGTGYLLLARLRGISVSSGLVILAAGAAVVVGAAPLDDFWHRTFGRDVDVWSFPHLVAIAGGVLMSCGAVAMLDAEGRRDPRLRRRYRVVAAMFLAVLLWLAMFSLNWYTLVLAAFRDSFKYPVLACLVSAGALVLASRTLGRYGATVAAGIYTVYVVLAHAALSLAGFALLPLPPAVIASALAVDLVLAGASRPRWGRIGVASALVAPSFYLAEAMSLAWLPHPPLRGMPVGEQALAYFEEAVARPWDVAHVAWALPFAVGAAVLSGLLGGWFARVATGQRQSAVGPRTAPPSADRSALQV